MKYIARLFQAAIVTGLFAVAVMYQMAAILAVSFLGVVVLQACVLLAAAILLLNLTEDPIRLGPKGRRSYMSTYYPWYDRWGMWWA